MTPETMIDWMQANARPLLMAHAVVSGFVLAYIILAAIDRLCGPGRFREEYRNICRAVCTLGLYPLLAWPWRVVRKRLVRKFVIEGEKCWRGVKRVEFNDYLGCDVAILDGPKPAPDPALAAIVQARGVLNLIDRYEQQMHEQAVKDAKSSQ